MADLSQPWRTGRKVGRHLYLQKGPEPSDQDEPIGTLDTPELAALAVHAVNEHLARQRARWGGAGD